MNNKIKKKKIKSLIKIALNEAKYEYQDMRRNIFELEKTMHNNHFNDIDKLSQMINSSIKEIFERFRAAQDLFDCLENRVLALIQYSSFVLWATEQKKYIIFVEEEFAKYKYYVETGKITREY